MINTDRLTIREFNNSNEDISSIFEIFSDKEVNKFLPMFLLNSKEDAQNYYDEIIAPQNEGKGLYLAICLKDINSPIGYIALSAGKSKDFGYGLKQEYWSMGIVSEAAEAVLNYIKTMDIPFITATHDVNNAGSGKVMQNIGMEYQYSYVEQWQPKDIKVTFRMYQYNFAENQPTFDEYWHKYPEHFIEDVKSYEEN